MAASTRQVELLELSLRFQTLRNTCSEFRVITEPQPVALASDTQTDWVFCPKKYLDLTKGILSFQITIPSLVYWPNSMTVSQSGAHKVDITQSLVLILVTFPTTRLVKMICPAKEANNMADTE